MACNIQLYLFNKLRLLCFVGFLVPLLVGGCGKRTMVVLLPDLNGKVGKIEVANPKGGLLLDEAYQSTIVARPGTAPKNPVIMEKAIVEKEFDRALKIMPETPITYTLFFESETTTLKDYSWALIPSIVKAIEERQATDVSVIGNTDGSGKDESDRILSFNRARKVADLLISLGVDASTIEVGYHGTGNPLIPTPDGIREPKNRRVDVTVR
jgi:outer membrane protein OmpA-like peptidoglycan-associated protein